MTWEDQGRQANGQFGHGTAAPPPPDPLGRIDAMAYGSMAGLAAAQRRHAGAAFEGRRLDQFRHLINRWAGGDAPDGMNAPGSAMEQLGVVADTVRNGRTQADLTRGSMALAAAMQEIGLDRWPGFLARAADTTSGGGTATRTVAVVPAPPGPDPAPVDPALLAFRSRFDRATALAYQQYSRDCSHYLQTFLIEMGYPETPYRTANQFMAFVARNDSGWVQVTAAEAPRLVASGRIVVAGLAQQEGNGHVSAVGPKTLPAPTMLPTAPARPASPQIFSGARSWWAGAKSQGEHSVRDAWKPEDVRNVTYWMKQ